MTTITNEDRNAATEANLPAEFRTLAEIEVSVRYSAWFTKDGAHLATELTVDDWEAPGATGSVVIVCHDPASIDEHRDDMVPGDDVTMIGVSTAQFSGVLDSTTEWSGPCDLCGSEVEFIA